MTAPGRLARLADLAYRRRGRVLLTWVVATAAVAGVAPRLAGEFSSEFATAGSESKAAADLISERFPGTSGDTIEVVWQGQTGVREPAVRPRVERFSLWGGTRSRGACALDLRIALWRKREPLLCSP